MTFVKEEPTNFAYYDFLSILCDLKIQGEEKRNIMRDMEYSNGEIFIYPIDIDDFNPESTWYKEHRASVGKKLFEWAKFQGENAAIHLYKDDDSDDIMGCEIQFKMYW